MHKFRRGFKSESNDYSREYRRELGLALNAPLSPWRLAEHLAIPIYPMSDFAQSCRGAVDYLAAAGQGEFSAFTLIKGTKRFIVWNDSHHRHRQASNLAHELAHVVLGHPLQPFLNDDGSRIYNSELEAEANWLGPALLVSEEAAIHIQRSLSLASAVNQYQVSESLIRMRINVTGAARRVKRMK